MSFKLFTVLSLASGIIPIAEKPTELSNPQCASNVKPDILNPQPAENTTRPHELKIHQFRKRGAIITLNETRETELQLGEYYNQLRRYLENGFDERNFVLVSKHFRERLSELEDMVSALSYNRVISAQLRFITLVFRMMTNAVESLRFFHLRRLAQFLVRAIIKLNLRLLSLHDSYGVPDPSLDNYNLVITRLRTLIQTWSQMFKNSKNEPSATWIMFRDQYTRAVRTLEFLESHAQ